MNKFSVFITGMIVGALVWHFRTVIKKWAVQAYNRIKDRKKTP